MEMVDALVDASILIDVLRGYAPAKDWLDLQPPMTISRITWLEVLQGVQDKAAQYRTLSLLRRFSLLELTQDDIELGGELLIKWRLSHNIDALDCLLSAVSLRLQVPVLTRNIKHFRPIIGELAQAPYM
jgi:predicted nucleic acid-binding protein